MMAGRKGKGHGLTMKRRCLALTLLALLLAPQAGHPVAQASPLQERTTLTSPSFRPWPWQSATSPAASATLGPTPTRTPLSTSAPTPTPTPVSTLTATPASTPTPMPTQPSTKAPAALESAPQEESATAEPTAPADREDVPPAPTPRREGMLSLLLIGVDSHGKDTNGRSDTVMLAQLNTKTCEVRLVSFLRDLYVKIPGRGKDRLNAAYYFGGAQLLQQTLESNFALQVDGTVAVDFRTLIRVVDQLGGVPVTMSQKEMAATNKLLREYNRDYGFARDDGLLAGEGEQRLTGKQALCFSRVRKLDSDFMRTGRQRRVLEGMLVQLRSLGLGDLLHLVTQNIDGIQTSLSLQDITGLLPLLLAGKDIQITGMQVPLTNAFQDDVVRGMMVLVPNLKKNTAAIEAFLE